jgi:hypothetical protein
MNLFASDKMNGAGKKRGDYTSKSKWGNKYKREEITQMLKKNKKI